MRAIDRASLGMVVGSVKGARARVGRREKLEPSTGAASTWTRGPGGPQPAAAERGMAIARMAASRAGMLLVACIADYFLT